MKKTIILIFVALLLLVIDSAAQSSSYPVGVKAWHTNGGLATPTNFFTGNSNAILIATGVSNLVENATNGLAISTSNTFILKDDGLGTNLTAKAAADDANGVAFTASSNVVHMGWTHHEGVVTNVDIVYIADGAVGSPSLVFTDDGNTGIYSSASDRISFSVAGIQRAEWYASGLNIGTAYGITFGGSAWLRYDASGIMAMRNGATAHKLRIYYTDSGSDDEYLEIGADTTKAAYVLESIATGAGTVHPVMFVVNSLTNLFLDTSGEVTIQGTKMNIVPSGSTFTFEFDGADIDYVNGGFDYWQSQISGGPSMNLSANTANALFTFNGDTDTGVGRSAANTLTLWADAEVVWITNSSVGIMTNSPQTALHVNGDVTVDGDIVFYTVAGADSEYLVITNDSTKAAYVVEAAATGAGTERPLMFVVNSLTNLILDTSGELTAQGTKINFTPSGSTFLFEFGGADVRWTDSGWDFWESAVSGGPAMNLSVSTTAPTWAHNGDTDTGIGRSAANTLTLWADDAQAWLTTTGLGIKTNSPQTELHVNGDVLIETNLTVLGTTDLGGHWGTLSLSTNHDFNLAVSSTKYAISNYNQINTGAGFASDNEHGFLTNSVAGDYYITINISFNGSGGAGDNFHGVIMTNGVTCSVVEWHRKTNSNDTGSAVGSSTVNLPADCYVQYRVENEVNTGTITVLHATMDLVLRR